MTPVLQLITIIYIGFFYHAQLSSAYFVRLSSLRSHFLPFASRSTDENNSSVPSILAPISSDFASSYTVPSTTSEDWIAKPFIPTGPTELAKFENEAFGSSKPVSMTPRSSTTRRYFELVEKLSPNEMLQTFAETAPKNVQEATKSTIVNILGSLPNYALDAAMITTSSKLANLLYQMQITGYMFKNAEYRMSLTRSLKGLPKLPVATVINKGNISFSPLQESVSVAGTAIVHTSQGDKVEVNVNELMGVLSKEVEELRAELAVIRGDREAELRSNLLTYIQALPERDMVKLTASMSNDVVDAIQLLVNGLMGRLGIDINGPDVIVQQSVTALAQLCMWQMVVGYRLREFEAVDKGVIFGADE